MKKSLILSALLLGASVFASDYNYEITPVIGYNIAEGNIDIKDQTLVGGEFQYNGFDSIISPELSVLYTNADYEGSFEGVDNTGSTNIYRIALNGVYEFDKIGAFVPLVKAGLGYETMSSHLSENYDSPFLDAGIGAKINFTKQLALKLEAIYMNKHNDSRWDSNMAALVGLSYSFGEKVKPAPAPAPAPVVDGDDDHDGVPNSKDECPTTAPGIKVDNIGCELDSDGDGVPNAQDRCPTTPKGEKVNQYGCPLDSDKDGVTDDKDICPNTPLGSKVNSDGCPVLVNLHINFETNSYKIKQDSYPQIEKYADFLNKYTNYSAKIIGHTDDRGSAAYNKKLSQNRANAVKDAIVKLGVDASRIEAIGMGEEKPVATNSTAEGRAKNRRIEAELIKN